ncbi:MAG: SdpI family protein [Bacteroidia bacterium]
MKTLKNDWLIWVIILAPYFFIAYFWNKFPDQIATHFGLGGKPDDYSSKVTGLILFPGINVLMYFIFIILPKIDPSRKNYGLFQDKFKIIRTLLHALLSFVTMTTVFYSLGYQFNLSFVIFYGLLAFFLVMGNYIGNVRHNYFIGVRTPWTLANEAVWTKTHRLTAKIWVASSLLMMVLLPFFSEATDEILFMIFVGVTTVVPIVYSYIEFRKTIQHE